MNLFVLLKMGTGMFYELGYPTSEEREEGLLLESMMFL